MSALIYPDVAESPSKLVQQMHHYWRGKAAPGRLPSRLQIDPPEIRQLLPNIMLVDIEPDPFRIRYRLVGTKVADMNGFDFSHRYLDECGFASTDFILRTTRQMVASRQPVAGTYDWLQTNVVREMGMVGHCHFGCFPLATASEAVDGMIAIEEYI